MASGEEECRELLLTFALSEAGWLLFWGEACDLEKEWASSICQVVSLRILENVNAGRVDESEVVSVLAYDWVEERSIACFVIGQ